VSTLVGGLRLRVIQDSMRQLVEEGLDGIGWFESGRQHEPVNLVEGEPDWNEPIEPNSVAVNLDTSTGFDAELGSNLQEERIVCYVDVYAEDDAVGMHLSHDIRDILRGKMPSIGRTEPTLEVYDFSAATPDVIFNCDIEDVTWDRGRSFTEKHLRHWFVVACDLVDVYGDENDDADD